MNQMNSKKNGIFLALTAIGLFVVQILAAKIGGLGLVLKMSEYSAIATR